jgi:zinc protease
MTAFATVPPEAMDETAAAIRAVAGEPAVKAPSSDLLTRARALMRAHNHQAQTQNADWLGLIAKA